MNRISRRRGCRLVGRSWLILRRLGIDVRSSKTALNMLMLDWNHKLKADGVKVWGVGPGFLAMGLGGITEKVREMGGVDILVVALGVFLLRML
ncbi:hypothetical protein BDV28DRAFT_142289 [Aspergillus coremiiformis]|uniref:Uncharacterized protein n=1 Tax=Aspergillus coremiiformis TaxID=138285 RepID=A0A5N6YTZ5_9EURO|nr:hypothetical protein BDV28DRAFT_142289 [Aspergillus coremiiformis]